MSKGKNMDTGASEGARRATGEAPVSEALVGRGRWSAQRKVSVILELLRGADLETLSRRDGVTAATICSWRDAFLASGEAGLKSRESEAEDAEKTQLKSVVAELAVSNELLKEKIRLMEKNRPLGFWKSRP